MGKKQKVGKARRDKFYFLAKETGFRSRSAFKLVQLNRKYDFLQKAHVLIDLCAAPGGWMQVALQNMPVSSLIVGVDLASIKPIGTCITLQEDITTEKCRQELNKVLKTAKADVVLNDGAPNVGKNWLYDAYSQSELTLQALRLAVQFLKPKGTFVTKVFRSQDYEKLMWVFNKLFKNVHATKPQASRHESAEIFVTCMGFLAPDTLDPRFLDPKHIFKDADEPAPKKTGNVLLQMKRQKKNRGGYEDGDIALFHPVSAREFLGSDDFKEMILKKSSITLDDEAIRNHPATTDEVRQCCEDIKTLGSGDIAGLLKWRKILRRDLGMEPEVIVAAEDDPKEESDVEERALKQAAQLEEDKRKDRKKRLKKERKESGKLQRKVDAKMVFRGDVIEQDNGGELFQLKTISSQKGLQQVRGEGADDTMKKAGEVLGLGEDDEDELLDIADLLHKKRLMAYDRAKNSVKLQDDLEPFSDSESENPEDDNFRDKDGEGESDSPDEMESGEENPLLVPSIGNEGLSNEELWFSKDMFHEIRGSTTEENGKFQKKGTRGDTELVAGKIKTHDAAVYESDGSSDDEDEPKSASDDSDNSEDESPKKGQSVRRLDAVGLAIGKELVKSRKRRREMEDFGWNRYAFNDDFLPSWFVVDERKYRKGPLPVEKKQIDEQKERLQAIDTRTIKKVGEAKARKKRKAMKKLEGARAKADAITDGEDMNAEKWKQIKDIYKRATSIKKKPSVTYVVAKKAGGLGRKVHRPAGVKGNFKVVDPRMKKDLRAQQKRKRK